MKNGIIKRIICGISACAIGVLSLTSARCIAVDQDLIGNQKYQARVEEKLDANMQIMKNNSKIEGNNLDNLIRLKPNESGKIYVSVDDRFSDNVKSNIQKSINDFNKIFSVINNNYNFVTCSSKEINEHFQKNETIVRFCPQKLEEDILACTSNGYNKIFNIDSVNITKNLYITDSEIYLNSSFFDSLSDVSQIGTIKHELLHVLGFADIYEKDIDETTMVNTKITGFSTLLSPNDIKMIYVAYGNKHINKDGSFNNEKIEQVSKLINKYEEEYYRVLVKNIQKKAQMQFESLSIDEIVGNEYENKGASIKINDNLQFNYTKDNYSKTGKAIVGDNYVILPNIVNNEKNDYLMFVKINGAVKCYDVNMELSSELGKQIDNSLVRFS